MCTCIFSKLWPTPTPPTGHVSKKLSSKPQQPLRLSRSSWSVSTSSPEARLKSETEAEAKAEERAQRVKHYTEAETDYRAGLNDQMLRLELANPVGPRTGVPLVSDHRLKQEIEAGDPSGLPEEPKGHEKERLSTDRRSTPGVEQRRDQEQDPCWMLILQKPVRCWTKRFMMQPKKTFEPSERTSRMRLDERAIGTSGRQTPPAASRKKIKKQRKREGQGHTKDDAERDRNHAIAHQTAEGSSLAGGLSAPNLSNFDQGLKRSPGDALEAEWDLDQASGMIFAPLKLSGISIRLQE